MKGTIEYTKLGSLKTKKFSGTLIELQAALYKHMDGNPRFTERSTGDIYKVTPEGVKKTKERSA